MLAEKQALLNNVEEHDLRGLCILRPALSVDDYTFKLTKVSTKSQVLQRCLQNQGTFSSAV